MEDFVSFEIAKKLKEKGFREKCLCRYHNYSKTLHINKVEPEITRKIDYSEFFKCYNSYVNSDIDAPTISQVLKWLRKEKKIYVLIEVEYEDWFEYKIVQTIKGIRGSSTRVYETFEEAALAGIEYVLDNLI